MSRIQSIDILKWQNEIIKLRKEDGSEYSSVYFKTIQSQLSAIFNHAVRFYNLKSNPVKKVGPLKGGKPPVFQYWTKEEYEQFIGVCEKDTNLYYAYTNGRGYLFQKICKCERT